MGAAPEGNTIDAPPITLTRGAPRGGIVITFKVTKEGGTFPVREAHIKLRDSINAISDDYYRTTNNDGVGTIRLPGPGTYPFSVTNDSFEPYDGQGQLGAGGQAKSVEIGLQEKARDKPVTVTVLAGQGKNGRGGNEPISG